MAAIPWTQGMYEIALGWQQLAGEDFNKHAEAIGLAWRMSPPVASTVVAKPVVLSLLKHAVRGGGVAASAIVLPLVRGKFARRAVTTAVSTSPTFMTALYALPVPQALAIAAIGASGDRLGALLWRLARKQLRRQLAAEADQVRTAPAYIPANPRE